MQGHVIARPCVFYSAPGLPSSKAFPTNLKWYRGAYGIHHRYLFRFGIRS